MTSRVYNELQKLWEDSDKDVNSNVFKFSDIRKSFNVACEEAGIETGRPHGITIHSLRHTAATRLVKGQMPIQMVGRILSHQDPITTYRYLTANDETLKEAVTIFESIQAENEFNSQNQIDIVIESDFMN